MLVDSAAPDHGAPAPHEYGAPPLGAPPLGAAPGREGPGLAAAAEAQAGLAAAGAAPNPAAPPRIEPPLTSAASDSAQTGPAQTGPAQTGPAQTGPAQTGTARGPATASTATSGLYFDVFQLRERPFTLLPDPDFLFWTPSHQRAFTVLEYGILSRAPITVVTGEVGVGKTTLVQKLLASLEDSAIVGLISNAHGGRGDLLRWVLNALDLRVEQGLDYVALFQRLQDFLLEQYAQGRYVVLVIDEAQNLSLEALEELRMLTNINANKDELVQLLLVGQPELRAMVERPEMRQFAQRVTANFHLTGMDQATTRRYISHRMRHAGGTGTEFQPEATARIHEVAEGIPRVVNKVCDLALLYAAGEGKNYVDLATVEDVLTSGIFIMTRPTSAPAGGGQAE